MYFVTIVWIQTSFYLLHTTEKCSGKFEKKNNYNFERFERRNQFTKITALAGHKLEQADFNKKKRSSNEGRISSDAASKLVRQLP